MISLWILMMRFLFSGFVAFLKFGPKQLSDSLGKNIWYTTNVL